MSLLESVRLAPQKPQILCVPPDVASLATADDTIELARTYELVDGGTLSESQQIRLRNGMAERAGGRWAAKRVGDFGGRQGAGKTGLVMCRIFGGLMIVGERLIIYTAHEFPTANEVFLRVGAVLEAWDDLSRLVLSEQRSHGDQGFVLRGPKGAELTEKRRLLFKTRTGKSGRGFSKADLIVYDEAQHLLRTQIAGSGPAKLANPNSQSWWSGSGGFATSGPAWEMRRQAILGTGGRLAYAEHTAETFTVKDGKVAFTAPDFTDRDAWYRANPGLGDWVSEEDLADLIIELGELAPQELGCIWVPEPGSDVGGNLPNWDNCGDPDSTIASHHTWAVATSADRKWSTIGVAGRRADGDLHVGVHRRQSGTDWVVDEAVKFWESTRVPVRIWKNGPENSFIAPLRERGVEVVEVSTPEVTQATGQMRDGVEAGVVWHPVHVDGKLSALDRAVAAAEFRESSDGAAVWSQRNSSVEITPLLAVTVALGGVPVVDPALTFAY